MNPSVTCGPRECDVDDRLIRLVGYRLLLQGELGNRSLPFKNVKAANTSVRLFCIILFFAQARFFYTLSHLKKKITDRRFCSSLLNSSTSATHVVMGKSETFLIFRRRSKWVNFVIRRKTARNVACNWSCIATCSNAVSLQLYRVFLSGGHGLSSASTPSPPAV